MASTIAVYAGSFDPLTFGHLDIIRRGSKVFDTVIVAVGANPNKRCLLDPETRVRIISEATSDLPGVRTVLFRGLLVEFCKNNGAAVIIRGLRAVTDFEFEFQIGLANRDMAPEIETVFLLPAPRNIFISSSLVKEIFAFGGDISSYVPAVSHRALAAASAEQ